MTVFLGDSGAVKLARKGSEFAQYAEITAADVDVSRNRFSIDFAHEQIITGDRVEVMTAGENEGEDLNWIADPTADDAFTRYVHIDAAGGIRFYDTFSQALEGKKGITPSCLKPLRHPQADSRQDQRRQRRELPRPSQ